MILYTITINFLIKQCYIKNVTKGNSFKALPVFIALIIFSVLSITVFQSYSIDKNETNGQVMGLENISPPFPVFPNSKILSQTESDKSNNFTFQSTANSTSINQWYKTEIVKEGWMPTTNQFIYTKGNERLEISVLDNSDKSTLIIINYIY